MDVCVWLNRGVLLVAPEGGDGETFPRRSLLNVAASAAHQYERVLGVGAGPLAAAAAPAGASNSCITCRARRSSPCDGSSAASGAVASFGGAVSGGTGAGGGSRSFLPPPIAGPK